MLEHDNPYPSDSALIRELKFLFPDKLNIAITVSVCS